MCSLIHQGGEGRLLSPTPGPECYHFLLSDHWARHDYRCTVTSEVSRNVHQPHCAVAGSTHECATCAYSCLAAKVWHPQLSQPEERGWKDGHCLTRHLLSIHVIGHKYIQSVSIDRLLKRKNASVSAAQASLRPFPFTSRPFITCFNISTTLYINRFIFSIWRYTFYAEFSVLFNSTLSYCRNVDYSSPITLPLIYG